MKKMLTFMLMWLVLCIASQPASAAKGPTCVRKITAPSGRLYILKTSFKKTRVISYSKGKGHSFPAKITNGKIVYKASGDKKWYTLTKDGVIFRAGQANAAGTHNCDIDKIIGYMNGL